MLTYNLADIKPEYVKKNCHILQKWRNGLMVNMIRAGR